MPSAGWAGVENKTVTTVAKLDIQGRLADEGDLHYQQRIRRMRDEEAAAQRAA